MAVNVLGRRKREGAFLQNVCYTLCLSIHTFALLRQNGRAEGDIDAVHLLKCWRGGHSQRRKKHNVVHMLPVYVYVHLPTSVQRSSESEAEDPN